MEGETQQAVPQMEGETQQAAPAEAVPQERQERENKWAAKYRDHQVGLHDDGGHVYACGRVARIKCTPSYFDVLIAGTNVWFRIGFHVDVAKWAFMEGKTVYVTGAEEAEVDNWGGNIFIADHLSTGNV